MAVAKVTEDIGYPTNKRKKVSYLRQRLHVYQLVLLTTLLVLAVHAGVLVVCYIFRFPKKYCTEKTKYKLGDLSKSNSITKCLSGNSKQYCLELLQNTFNIEFRG